MSVTAIHLWTCDICGMQTAQVQSTDAWDDPVITPPEGWKSDFDVPENYRSSPQADICHACPACQITPDWTKYKGD